jgi:hypothetical protein
VFSFKWISGLPAYNEKAKDFSALLPNPLIGQQINDTSG